MAVIMEKNMEIYYEKYYNNNNKLICESLANLIKNSEEIRHIMVSDFVSEFSRIKFIEELYIADSDFTFCDFPYSMENCIFKNVEFRGCNFSSMRLENVQFINCKFFRCTFYTINQCNCTFAGTLIEDCIFKGCKTSGKNNFLSAEEIRNPTFSNCILPDYVTADFVYKTEKIKDEQYYWMHANSYFFIKSCKLITVNGMIVIDDYIKTGVITDSIRNVFFNNITISDSTISDDDIHDILHGLIAKRKKVISKLVLEGFNEK